MNILSFCQTFTVSLEVNKRAPGILAVLLIVAIFPCIDSTANASISLNVAYTNPVINSGPISFGLSELPAVVNATFLLGAGSPTGGGATGYDLSDVLSANLPFGDGVWTTLMAFDMEVESSGLVETLSYTFSPIDTLTAQGPIVINFPLSITGTDISSGKDFSYTYANSTQEISSIPEPVTLAIWSVLGFIGAVSHYRRRR